MCVHVCACVRVCMCVCVCVCVRVNEMDETPARNMLCSAAVAPALAASLRDPLCRYTTLPVRSRTSVQGRSVCLSIHIHIHIRIRTRIRIHSRIRR